MAMSNKLKSLFMSYIESNPHKMPFFWVPVSDLVNIDFRRTSIRMLVYLLQSILSWFSVGLWVGTYN